MLFGIFFRFFFYILEGKLIKMNTKLCRYVDTYLRCPKFATTFAYFKKVTVSSRYLPISHHHVITVTKKRKRNIVLKKNPHPSSQLTKIDATFGPLHSRDTCYHRFKCKYVPYTYIFVIHRRDLWVFGILEKILKYRK